MNSTMEKDIKRVLLSQEEIREKVAEVGAKISADYAGKNLLLVGILKGSVVFMSDLMRAITLPASIDFMSVSSYGSGVKSSGVVRIVKDLEQALEGYDLLLVEDILDSGLTLSYLRGLLQNRHPNSIRIVTLRIYSRTTAALRSPTSLWWAMAWTMPKSTGICPMWVY